MKKTYSIIGIDGNAHSIIGYVVRAMKQCGMPKEDIDDYKSQALAGSYNHLLQVSQEIINELNS